MRYAPWIILPGIALLIALAFAIWRDERPRTFAGSDETHLVRDKKVRRTGTNFADQSRGNRRPLYEINRPGIDIALTIDAHQWQLMRLKSNRRTYRQRAVAASVAIDGREPSAAMLRLRGGGSLDDPVRPNFRVSMVRAESFAPDIDLDVIYLMNLRHDIPQVDTVFSYRLLTSLGLFHPHVQFVRVSVNGEPMGIFLLIEPPTTAIRRTHPDAVGVYRRSQNNAYTPQWTKAVAASGETIADLEALCTEQYPTDEIDRLIDLDQIFAWACTNALLKNDDTRDELFLFERRTHRSQPGRLSVMAWDYDDILRNKSVSADPLLHSITAAIERKILDSPELYERMRKVYARLLTDQLAVDRVIGTLHDVHRLRDSLDDGRPEKVQAADRAPRAARVAEYEALIRARHARLLAAAQSSSPSLQPSP